MAKFGTQHQIDEELGKIPARSLDTTSTAHGLQYQVEVVSNETTRQTFELLA